MDMLGIFSEPAILTVSLLTTGCILFLLVYFIIILSDFECDYLNARQCCLKLNTWIVPKLSMHTVIVVLLLLNGQWILTLVHVPLTIWLFYEYYNIPVGNIGIFDPVEIYNRGQLRKHTRECMIYLGYYLVFFFIYLYCLIVTLLKGDPINRNEDDMVMF